MKALLVAVPVVALLVLTALRDTTTALALAGLCAVVAGFCALISGRERIRARARHGAVAVLVVGGAGMFLGGTAFAAPGVALPGLHGSSAAADLSAAPLRAREEPALATSALSALTVKGPSPMTGYQRVADFGQAWYDEDHNGCDTRNDILRRDLAHVAGTRCKVLSGVLHDPYTGRTIDFVRGPRTSEAVQIDHVVPLADAWRTGAQKLTPAARTALANDPANLYAVDGPTNVQKSDGDAATWLPPAKAFRCTYVAHQIAVKRAYALWVTPAERAAMERVLARCPGQRLPADTGAPATLTAHRPAPTPSATPTASASPATTPTVSATASAAPGSAPPSASAPAGGDVVHPGAFCSPEGATGVTTAGTRMVCGPGSDGKLRWHRAS